MKISLHEILKHENFTARKFPDIWQNIIPVLGTYTELSHNSTYWGGISSSLYTQAVRNQYFSAKTGLQRGGGVCDTTSGIQTWYFWSTVECFNHVLGSGVDLGMCT